MTLTRIPPDALETSAAAAAPLADARPSLAAILDRDLTREEVLERIDPETLRTAPLNLLTATAVAIAAPDTATLTEDAVLRYTTALTGDLTGEAYVRLTAEKLVLADVEYQAAIAGYAAAEAQTPCREDWRNPQHFLEALKVHERRMDRLLRARKEAFDRYETAAGVYRTAVLTSRGQEILLRMRTEQDGGVIQGTSGGAEVVSPAGGGSTTTMRLLVR